MEIITSELQNCEMVSITGRVDSFTAPRLAEVLSELTTANKYNIVLDLSKVDYISSAGLRVMIDAQKTCKHMERGEVVLLNVPKRIYDTLELAGFVPLFKSFKDSLDATKHF